jgi:hypothetical protein
MKSIHIFVMAIFLVLSTQLSAQSYQPFQKNDKVHYTYYPVSPPVFVGGDWDFPNKIFYEVCNVDSATFINTDSVFYFNPAYPKNFNSNRRNFLGEKMLKKNNGDYCFIEEHDTITLKMNISSGSSWQHTNGINFTIVTVTYKGKRYYPVYDGYDSVNVFEVQTPDFVDSIVLSRNNGIVHAFALFSPEHLSYDQSYNYNQAKGENKFNFKEYYSFDVGDLFLYNKFAHAYTNYVTTKTYLHILSRKESLDGDTIEYGISICNKPLNSSATWYSTSLKVTEFDVIGFPSFFWTPIGQQLQGLLKVPFTSGYECMMDTIENYIEFDNISHFYVYEISAIKKSLLKFKKEIGLTYVREIAPYGQSSELVSFGGKVNYIPTGNENSLLEVYEQILDNQKSQKFELLTVFPNPVKGELFIKLPENKGGELFVSIFNAIGKKMYETSVEYSEAYVKINVEVLSPGYYLMRIDDGNNIICKSFLKQ